MLEVSKWAGLLDARCPVCPGLSFWFYFCVFKLPEVSVRRYTVYIGIAPTCTISQICSDAPAENSTFVPSSFPSTLTHPHCSELTLSLPPAFLCQCGFYRYWRSGYFGCALVMPANEPGCISEVVKLYTICRYLSAFGSSSLKVAGLTGDRALWRSAVREFRKSQLTLTLTSQCCG